MKVPVPAPSTSLLLLGAPRIPAPPVISDVPIETSPLSFVITGPSDTSAALAAPMHKTRTSNDKIIKFFLHLEIISFLRF